MAAINLGDFGLDVLAGDKPLLVNIELEVDSKAIAAIIAGFAVIVILAVITTFLIVRKGK
jgi:hypothetical protein